MSNPATAIRVTELEKTFEVPERDAGLLAATRSLFARKTRTVHAVRGVSFEIASGEVVGFLGPNGAGKTTTLKVLCGLLHPTGGHAEVLGHVPAQRRHDFLRRITLLMGNRNQLQWDLPAADSFDLNQAIYRIPPAEYRRTRAELLELLEIGDLIRKPVRTLSLGERMKVEIAGSLLHRPEVLFLDEPTLGLDLSMQKRIRAFLVDHNRRHGTTILLTSHYMADVEALCRRVVVIDRGRVLSDGPLSALSDRFAAHKEIELTVDDAGADFSRYGLVVRQSGQQVRLRVAKEDAPTVVADLLARHSVVDMTIEDPPVEDVIELVLGRGSAV